MDIIKYLQAQGIGSRKQCRILWQQGRIAIDGIRQPEKIDDVNKPHILTLDEKIIPTVPLPHFYIVLNKPAGYETSHKPVHHPSVFSLLPDNFRYLDIQAVGRLDADTTGILIITDDGAFNHRLTASKNHIPKTYKITLKHKADEKICEKLHQGVLLHDEKEIISAQSAILADEYTLQMTITSGKYHQVKRMIAAAGNRVEKLHRSFFGRLSADDLQTGQWRFININDVV